MTFQGPYDQQFVPAVDHRARRVDAGKLFVALALVWAQASCIGAHETPVRRDLIDVRRQRSHGMNTPLSSNGDRGVRTVDPRSSEHGGGAGAASRIADEAAASGPEGGLSAYVATALEHNADLAAAFARWEASVHRISRARRLPEPTIGFGYFLSSIETRVGPQQARLSLKQAFPWPTKLSAGADAMAARARAAQRRFEAQALRVSQRVARAFWMLWEIRRTRSVHRDHLHIMRGLSQAVRARIATGAGTLADQQQVDLSTARLADAIAGMDEAERAAEAHLRAAIGLESEETLATPDEPEEPAVPKEDKKALAALARRHPSIDSFLLMADAQESSARAEAADRFPSFSLGADWMITGEAAMPNAPESGKDAIIVGAGLRVPLWQGSYSDAEAAARAEAQAHRAQRRSAIDGAMAELERSLSAVRDSARRVGLHRHTLLPQADAAYASVLGAYTSGRGTVAQVLLSQRDLLDLRVELLRARAEHAREWARLEQVSGQELTRVPFTSSEQGQVGTP